MNRFIRAKFSTPTYLIFYAHAHFKYIPAFSACKGLVMCLVRHDICQYEEKNDSNVEVVCSVGLLLIHLISFTTRRGATMKRMTGITVDWVLKDDFNSSLAFNCISNKRNENKAVNYQSQASQHINDWI